MVLFPAWLTIRAQYGHMALLSTISVSNCSSFDFFNLKFDYLSYLKKLYCTAWVVTRNWQAVNPFLRGRAVTV